MLVEQFRVDSPNVSYTETHIEAKHTYETTELLRGDGAEWTVKPTSVKYEFRTDRRLPKLGMMLVGLGGNNGTTLTGGILANKHGITWMTKDGLRKPNFWGSITQAATCRIGNFNGEEIFTPFKSLLPMVDPLDIVIGGWDISSLNMAEAMERAKVLDWELQQQLVPLMKDMKPLPERVMQSQLTRFTKKPTVATPSVSLTSRSAPLSTLASQAIFDPDFVAANQEARADNVLKGSKKDQVEEVRQHIRQFKQDNDLDKVIVLWTANTERYADVISGFNDTAENLLEAVDRDESEIAPSTLYAIASIKEGAAFINGSPQNTFVPGLIDLACQLKVLIGGDDFKSGQTKMKSVLVDFLVGAGIKPVSIMSYNHLGNNDGMNLSAPQTFRSKEISKSNVVDDMVASNSILYGTGEHPDHTIVIKYLPYVGDSKRAMDEYTSEIFMGGKNTIVMHNTCEDSLLAAPIVLDLVLLAELVQRIEVRKDGEADFHGFHPVAVLLSYLTKAPLVPEGTPVVNALARQRAMLENMMRACIGLPVENNMMLEFKF